MNTRFTRARLTFSPSRFPLVITCNYIDWLADFNRRPGMCVHMRVKGGHERKQRRVGTRNEIFESAIERNGRSRWLESKPIVREYRRCNRLNSSQIVRKISDGWLRSGKIKRARCCRSGDRRVEFPLSIRVVN